MKRIGCLIAALSCRTGGEAEPTLRIGVALYQQEDTFIETVTRELQRVALEKEQAQNCKINLYIADGKESQTSQNEQVDRFLERGYDVICVNIVDRTAAAVIVDKAQAAGDLFQPGTGGGGSAPLETRLLCGSSSGRCRSFTG